MREETKINTDKINSGSLCSARKVLSSLVIIARAKGKVGKVLFSFPPLSYIHVT